jgi:histidine triad (HIT) family protein
MSKSPSAAAVKNISGIVYDDNNIFAKIIRGEIPSYKVYESETRLGILDAFPVSTGHCLFMPKLGIKASTLLDLDIKQSSLFLSELPIFARAVKEALGDDHDGIY